jgi:hypothetical protein
MGDKEFLWSWKLSKVFAEIVQQIVMMISNWLFLFHIASKLVQYVAILLGHSKMDIALWYSNCILVPMQGCSCLFQCSVS